MNNNNLFNTNTFIGTTHQDYFKVSSNALSTQINITSNILEQHLNYTSNILEQHLNYTSNILDIRASNFTTTTSNLILARYDKLINEKNEDILLPIPTTLKHTYIMNSNVAGEIRFWCKDTQSFPIVVPLGVPDYRVKIDVDGRLKVYYTYDPAINLTFFNGWVDVGNSIAALNASDANITAAIGAIDVQVNLRITELDTIVNQILLGLQYAMTEEQYENMTDEIAAKLGENDITTMNWTSLRTNLNNFFRTGTLSYLQNAINIVSIRLASNPIILTFLGIGGIAFAAYVSARQNIAYIDTINSLIKQKINNAYDSNIITAERRNLLLSSNNELIVDNYIEYCSNIYNGTVAQGFINTNITTQQYLSNIKCDSLYLNNGNISGINYVNVNNIVADGKIKENNKFLDTTYLTSNHIYNLAYNYTAERQYPSKLYNNTSTEDTVSLLGKLVYHQILYLDNQSIAYGSGFYELYSSSTYDTPTTKDRLFNFNTTETTTSSRWAISLYNSGTGNYQGDNSIDNTYFGDWVIIKMPKEILLTRYRIYQRSDFLTKAPAEWKVYGSNDGITFTEITEASQTTRLTSYTSGYYEKSLNPSFITQYQYFGFVFKSLLSTSGQTDLSFTELQIFGKEIISNSIVSNIYTTSNAVKNIVQYDMSVIGKHYGFYITISTPIVINGTTFYKYDINLTPYCNKGVIQIGPQSGDTFRSFKIRVMYATMFFSYIVNDLPNVCYYEVFMSYKNTAAPPNGSAGLNACSIGFPPNPTLQAVMPNNLFVIKNGAGSIDYITVVSSSPADARVIIEDLIG